MGPARMTFRLRTAPCAALLALLVSGCTSIEGPDGSFSSSDLNRAISKAESFLSTPQTGRIGADNLWLLRLAATHQPGLQKSPLFAIDPFTKYAKEPILRFVDPTWQPAGFEIRTADADHPAATRGGFYWFPSPYASDLYLPRDEVLLKALYGASTGFTEVDLTNLIATTTGQGDYDDTHALVALLAVRDQGCLPAETLAPHIARLVDILIDAQEKADLFNDLYAERVAFLYWAGAGDRVQPAWIARILHRQLPDGGWEADGSPGVNLHQTNLALLSLLYFKEGKPAQPFYVTPPRG